MNDNNNSQDQISQGDISYAFSTKEILYLGKFFRQYQDSIPFEVYNFSKFIEQEIYNNMSLEEASEFYK